MLSEKNSNNSVFTGYTSVSQISVPSLPYHYLQIVIDLTPDKEKRIQDNKILLKKSTHVMAPSSI